MPTVTLSRKVFEKLVGKKLDLDTLKDRISMLGTDLERIEGDEIVVEVFPNRPDMLSEQGFGRAFSSFIGKKTGLRDYKVHKGKEKVVIDNSVKKVRPYTACAIVKNLKFDDEKIREIIQIQEKLHVSYGRNRKKVAIGIYPSEKITYPISYKALKPEKIVFRPLEHTHEINGLRILTQHPIGREYGHLLEGWDKFPVFMDSRGKILSMPPIINSHDVGKIETYTTEVFIECSGFDFLVLSKCLNILVCALADMGGEIYSMELRYPDKKRVTPKLEPEQMKIEVDYVNKILGLELKEMDIRKLLERMGYGYRNKKVLVPAYRTDVLHQIDFAEDIAIAYGYENFEAEIPSVATIGGESEFEIFKRKVCEVLVGLGLNEVNTFHVTSEKNQNEMMNAETKLVMLENALTIEYNVLRSWMIPSLMEVLKSNKHREYPQKIFDVGRIFKKDKTEETGVGEAERLGVLLCYDNVDFTQIKQLMDNLFAALDVEYKIEETEHGSFVQGRVGRISVKDKGIAYIGEISPKVLEKWLLEVPVCALELNLTDLFELIE